MALLGIRSQVDWYALDDEDKETWEAFILWRDRQIERLLEQLNKRVADDKSVELTAYIQLLLARML